MRTAAILALLAIVAVAKLDGPLMTPKSPAEIPSSWVRVKYNPGMPTSFALLEAGESTATRTHTRVRGPAIIAQSPSAYDPTKTPVVTITPAVLGGSIIGGSDVGQALEGIPYASYNPGTLIPVTDYVDTLSDGTPQPEIMAHYDYYGEAKA